MRQVDSITVRDGNRERIISLWEGNPADISPDDPVDLIIVSAFRNDYTPTRWSIIGALHRKGLSVLELAEDKAHDLRSTAGFWVSRPLPGTRVGVRRILCFEPHFLGTQPTEVVGTLIRGLFPFLSEVRDAKVAMAVIATGAIGADPERVLKALVSAAVMWMRRGLPISDLRIMEQSPDRLAALAPVFAKMKTPPTAAEAGEGRNDFDVFLSFSKEDAADVDKFTIALRTLTPGLRLFDYRLSIDPGKPWQDEIERAVRASLRMVPLLSPGYFRSPECREELNMARLLHKRRNHSYLFPLYMRSLATEEELPLWLQTINYLDCREADPDKLAAAATRQEFPAS